MRLEKSAIHLWHADQADFSLDEMRQCCLAWLPENELRRYARYRLDRHRMQFLLGRILMRSVLSQYIDARSPKDWRFTENDFGKPAIHSEQQTVPLFFNLSHSGRKLVMAVAAGEAIGVDIERCTRPRRVSKISSRYFSDQEANDLLILTGTDRLRRFYDLWTLKEAYIKACGLGLAIPLQHFTYSFLQSGRIAIEFDARREDDPTLWQLWQIEVDEDYKLAIAFKASFAKQIECLSSWQMCGIDQFRELESIIVRKN